MSMLPFQFNARQVAPSTGIGDPLPTGYYIVAVTKSELKPTKDGTGQMIAMEFTVLDGEHKGRKVFTNFNIQNQNAKTVEIAFKDFSALCHATGVMDVQQTEQLHNIPLKIRVKVRPADGQYEASNDITQYKNVNDPAGTPGGNPNAQAARPMGPAGMPPMGAPTGIMPPAGNPYGAPQGAPQGAPAYGAPAGYGAPQAPAYGAPQGAGGPPAWQPPPQAPQGAPGGYGAAPQQAAPAMPAQPWNQGAPAGMPQGQPQGQPHPQQTQFGGPPQGMQQQQPVMPPAAAPAAPAGAGEMPPWAAQPQGAQ